MKLLNVWQTGGERGVHFVSDHEAHRILQDFCASPDASFWIDEVDGSETVYRGTDVSDVSMQVIPEETEEGACESS